MTTMEIYYDDLNNEAKKRFDKLFGPADTFNHDIAPLCIYEQVADDPCEDCRKCGKKTCPGNPDGDYGCFEDR